MFSEFRFFLEYFFVLWSQVFENPVPTASAYLPINSRTFKSQSKMLCSRVFSWRNICEKLPKAVSFTSVQITFNIIVGIGAGKVSAHNCRILGQSIHFPWLQTPTKVSTQPPERRNVSPLCTLTHSLKHFRTRFLNSEGSKSSEIDLWYFPHMPPPP